MIRVISQSRALYCYLLMSLWILLLICGIYKIFENGKEETGESQITTEPFATLGYNDAKTKRIFQICNFPEEISQGTEGILDPKKWSLKGVLILIRHGDRGPLQHVKKIINIDCGTQETDLLNSYKTYLHNLTISGKVQWTGPGPFHGFPILPTHPKQCHLGQLTMQGISQLLTIGQLLKQNYELSWPKLKLLRPEDVIVYSTRYRRTFQSALAFLYGLIHQECLAKISVLESQSMSFCFKDCGCPITEKLNKYVKKSVSQQLKSHPAVAALSEATGKSLFSTNAELAPFSNDPHAVRDALLTFVCHKNGLPCDSPTFCVKRQNVAGIIAYTDWVTHQKSRNIYWKRLCLLRSYGLVRHIVQQMLHMVSSSGPHLVLYSGHDHTLDQLTVALGLLDDPLLLRYGARVVFEVYKDNRRTHNNDAKGVYFRLVSNGRDVTKQVSFCKDLVRIDRKNYVCSMEDIVRFLHEDYFASLNVTNFKDACLRDRQED